LLPCGRAATHRRLRPGHPAPDCLGDLTRPVADAVRHWRGGVPAEQLLYVDTDPEWADTAAFVEHYGRDPAPPTTTGNRSAARDDEVVTRAS
jgi:hypothetical protein